ncbi:Golgi transport complex subunit 6 [Pichia californica]|nr:Golgi transport complex subunit 6 [[Candida] californica]
MDFEYDLETFNGGTKGTTNTNSGVSLSLRSLSTTDLSKKLQSLSLLDLARGKSTDINLDSSKNISISYNAQCIKRAKTSIDLLDSLGFDYNPLKSTSNNLTSSYSNNNNNNNNNISNNIDNDDMNDIFLYNSGFDGKSLVEKLTKILESSDGYDTSTRHSLAILERRIEYEISIENSSNSDIKKNSEKSKFENLKHLTSTGQTGNLARRNLRGLIEEDLLHQYSNQLRTFQKIIKSIDSVRPNIETITQEYNDLNNSLNKSVESLNNLKNDIKLFNDEKKIIDLKKNLLIAFKSTFTITQYEEHLIRLADLNDDITGIEFFNTIDKIKNIQNNCDVLLGMENEKLGLKIMKQMSDLLITINERIETYVQNNIDYVYSGSNSNSNYNNISKKINIKTFQKCLIYIWKNNRNNFDNIMASMVESRSRFISNDFINQLKGYSDEIISTNSITSSAHSKSNSIKQSRLFLSSYDTIKFLSDSLAYIHSLLVNEMENSRSFLTFDFISTNENLELEDMVGSVVSNIISGLNNPLKSAVESVLRQEVKLTTLINSYDLLELYSGMFSKLLVPTKNNNNNNNNNNKIISNETINKDNIISIMNSLKIETQDRVFFLIKLKLKNLQVEASEEGLSTQEDGNVLPDWVVNWYAFIDDIFESYNVNNKIDLNENHIIGLNESQWIELLELLINKPIEIMKTIEKNSKMPEKDCIIWEINCVDYMFNKLEINSSLDSKSEDLNSIIKNDTNKLIDLEFTGLLKSSGLYDIFNLINMIFKLDEELFDVSFYEPILENKLFSLETFQTANTKLEKFLSNYINQNELNGLMSPTIFNKVFFESSMNFIKFYKKLVLIVNEYLKDDDGNKIKVFQWDEMTIATLLGIDEYYQEHQDFK